jgi:transposase
MLDLTQCVLGVDLGDRKSLACVYRDGAVVEWFEFAMKPDAVRTAFEGKGYKRVALEAGAQSGWVTRLLRELGHEPVVANPRKLKAISANERKSDRRDALILAKLVWSDPSLLYPVHQRSEERALALTVLRARDTAVVARTRLINTVRSMSKAMGVRLKRGSAQGFALREAEVPPALAPSVTGLFVVLRALNEQIAAYDAQLGAMIDTSFPEARRVLQIRGVGPVTALAFVLTLEDPALFADGRTAAAYLGLVPRRDQSGACDRQLAISKTGNNFLRRLLVQCAQYILGPLGQDCDLRRWGHALMARGGKNAKKRAIVAAARKLAVLMFRMWKHDERWNPLHNSQPDASTVVAEGRPEPAVSDDCACCLEDAGDRAPRRLDCSSAGGSDPIMHRTPSGPSTSADRSVGQGTTSATTVSVPTKRTRSRTSARAPATPTAAAKPASAGHPASTRATSPRDGGKRIAGGRNKPARGAKKDEEVIRVESA